MRHFRTSLLILTIFCILRLLGPEVEARLAKFHQQHGQVLFGGKLLSETDGRYAIPDNLGGDAQRTIAGPQ